MAGGLCQQANFVLTIKLGHGRGEVALLQLLDSLHAHPDGLAQTGGNPDGNQRRNNERNGHQNTNDYNIAVSTGHKVRGIRIDTQTPPIGPRNRRIGQVLGYTAVLILPKAGLAGHHFALHCGQLFQGRITFRILHSIFLVTDILNVFMSNGVSVTIQHIGAAVFTDLEAGHNIVQERFGGYKVDHTGDLPALNTILPKRRGYHNRQLARNFADSGSGKPRIARQGLFEILPVRVIVAVKQAIASNRQQISPLHTVILRPGIHQGLFFGNGYLRITKCGNHAHSFDRVSIRLKLVRHMFSCLVSDIRKRLLQHRLATGVAHDNTHAAAHNRRSACQSQETDQKLLTYAFHNLKSPPKY